jgi:hypothetical protein
MPLGPGDIRRIEAWLKGQCLDKCQFCGGDQLKIHEPVNHVLQPVSCQDCGQARSFDSGVIER